MTKRELLSHELLQLPIVWRGNYKSYLSAVVEIGERFVSLLHKVDADEFEKNGRRVEEFTKDELIELTSNVYQSVITCLRIYLEEGSPSKAYQSLQEHFSIEGKFKEKTAPVKALEFEKLYPRCYRIRKSLTQLNKVEEIFHVPFEERYKIKSFRYSIPGYPTLYLANSLYVAFAEMGEYDFDSIYVSKFMHKSSGINSADLLNLRNDWIFSQDRFLARWPLTMACSLKVAHPEADFRPEYIMPQIILEWVRNKIKIGDQKKRVVGVTYSSSKIPMHKSGYYGQFYNIAIPAEKVNEVGYCSKLKGLFELTRPISFSQALSAGIEAEQDGQVKSIIDLWNNQVEYINTGFGKVETTLNKHPFGELYSLE